MNRITIKQILILNLILFMFCGTVTGSEFTATMSDVYNFNIKSSFNYQTLSGNDIFVNDGNIYAIVWNTSAATSGARSNSKLLKINRDSGERTSVDIPGKAYYLGAGYNNEICSIDQDLEEKLWHISFYDLDGKKLRKVIHKYKYKTFRHVYHHYEPVPLCYDDKSLIFYNTYEYETRNPILLIPLHLITGGHGSKVEYGEYIEIVPELINKESKRNSFFYGRIIDSSGFRRPFPLNNDVALFDSTKKREFSVGDYQVTAFELEDKDNNYYLNNNKLIKASDKMEIIDLKSGGRFDLPLPPLANILVYDYDKFKFRALHRNSDFWVEADDVYFVKRIHERTSAKNIICFYNGQKKQWLLLKSINDNGSSICMTIYKHNEDLYQGPWGDFMTFGMIKYKIQ